MKKKNYTVLIVDDHPIITEAYKKAFNKISELNDKITFIINIANDGEVANEIINSFISRKKYIDILFLDISIPPSKDGKILSGEDLGIIAKKFFSDVKIIISTTYSDNYRIHSIIRSINPDGFLIKNDINSTELIQAIETVILAPPYYSKTVLSLLRKRIANDYFLDKIDRRLLFELSRGEKMINLPTIIPLSLAGIEKRKRHLKQIFGIEDKGDKELIFIAREKGFI